MASGNDVQRSAATTLHVFSSIDLSTALEATSAKTLSLPKNSLGCYAGSKLLGLGSMDLVVYHRCCLDLGNGGVDPAGQNYGPGFGVDYCCVVTNNSDCCYGYFDPESCHSGIGHYF